MANNFLKFCETDLGTNLLTQVEYAADSQRTIGNQPGIARDKFVNKVLRQAAFVAHNIAQYMENVTGDSVLDDDNSTNFLATMAEAFGTLTAVSTKTTTYTVLQSDGLILGDATGGAFTITLPAAASSTGKRFTFKKIDSSQNLVTIDGNASEVIDGDTTQTLGIQYESISIISNGTAWFIVG